MIALGGDMYSHGVNRKALKSVGKAVDALFEKNMATTVMRKSLLFKGRRRKFSLALIPIVMVLSLVTFDSPQTWIAAPENIQFLFRASNITAPSDSGLDAVNDHTSSSPSERVENAAPEPPSSAKSPSDSDEWNRPRALSDIFPLSRHSEGVEKLLNISWFQPYVFLSYVRPLLQPKEHMEISLYSTGISMGNFQRDFLVVGCLIGSDLYAVNRSMLDVTVCRVPHRPRAGELMTVVLRNDETLQKAAAGPVRLNPGLTVSLEAGDVTELPTDVIIHSPDLGTRHDLRIVRSHQRMPEEIEGLEKEKLATVPRYEICMVTQMKPYTYLLDDWIDYHRRIGVDMVYIIDNDAPTDLSKAYKSREDVEVIYWPWKRSQVQALSYMLTMSRTRCEWLLIADADEFVMLGLGEDKSLASAKPLKKYINRRREEGFDQVFFTFIIMGPSGQVRRPTLPIPEAYTYLDTRQLLNGKVVCRTDTDWFLSKIHWSLSLIPTVSHVHSKDALTSFPVAEGDSPRLVHFQFRSWEEFSLKKTIESPSIFDSHGRDGGHVKPEAAKGYLSLRRKTQYVHFRDIYREVMKRADMSEQALVRTRGGIRCTVRQRVGEAWKRFEKQECLLLSMRVKARKSIIKN